MAKNGIQMAANVGARSDDAALPGWYASVTFVADAWAEADI